MMNAREYLRAALQEQREAQRERDDADIAVAGCERRLAGAHDRLRQWGARQAEAQSDFVADLRADTDAAVPTITASHKTRAVLSDEVDVLTAALEQLRRDEAAAKRQLDHCIEAVNNVVGQLVAHEAKLVCERIKIFREKADELWLSVAPLNHTWFPSRVGGAGSPLPVDPDVATMIGTVPPGLVDRQEPPAVKMAREQAAAERWRGFFDRLCGDPDAPLDLPAKHRARAA